MTRLLTRIGAMGLLIVITYGGIWAIPTRSDLVYASLLDKHKLLSTVATPRLIFVGGSGIALGLDSELLEQDLGLPVINMGVNAGFGLHFMLEEVQPFVQSGDVVVIIPEYEHFYGKLLEGDQNLLWALRILPTSFQQLTWQQIRQAIPLLPAFFQQRVREILQRTPDPVYNRAGFNEHGDFVNHLGLPNRAIVPYAIAPSGMPTQAMINRDALMQLATFQQEAHQKGATVVLMYPAIAENFWRYGNNQHAIRQLHDLISLHQIITQLAQPSDYVLPEQVFFDTVYHLSAEGRELRTKQIAAVLKRNLPILACEGECDSSFAASRIYP